MSAEQPILTLNEFLKGIDLKKHGNKPMVVFAKGNPYPVVWNRPDEKHIELGCGWGEIEESEYEKLGIE